MTLRKRNASLALVLVVILLCIGPIGPGCSIAAPPSTVAPAPTVADQVSAASTFDGSIILGRPTRDSMTVSVTANSPSSVYLEWGGASGSYSDKSGVSASSPASPVVIVIDGLSPNSVYYYRLAFRNDDGGDWRFTYEFSFRTQRAPGSSYSFVVQSDSHLLNKADPEIYAQSMRTMAGLGPDFLFDLGDTFLNDQRQDAATQSYETVVKTYTQQLPYFSIVARNAALFLTVGNHEGEYGRFLDGTADNLAAKSTKARTTYFPNPVPDDFYSGNSENEPGCGRPQNYYAFTWGDALYVSIDPYRYSELDPYDENDKDGWGWTLGKRQYDWFRKTLEQSNAKFKFVFAHHAIGNIRGGAEVAKLYEWGGYDRNGKYVFDEKRPGWGKPIQQVMKDAGVTIFFQGHDHLFAREVVDGVVYQTLPKPAEKVADIQNNYDAYPNGDVLMNSGFLRVSVDPEKVLVEYNRNYYVSADPQEGNTGVVYAYTVDSAHTVKVLKATEDDLSTYGGNADSGKEQKGEKSPKGGKQQGKGNNTGATTPSPAVPTATPVTKAPATAVPSSDGFSFTIQADSHRDGNTDVELYKQTLRNVASENPAFHVDLGDTFMAEKFARTQAEVEQRYIEDQSLFSILGTVLLLLVNGNHEGETGWQKSEGVSSLMSWARAARLKYFPYPDIGTMASGNTTTANYYAFVYGDAQFIVLDPFTFSTKKAQGDTDGWSYTLGKTQYDWLRRTLEESKAKYKFVFIHNLVGGYGKDARGGAEAARFFEWGGQNADGSYGFDAMRPGWGKPIHTLLVENGVTAVFHGHDHFYARQQLDGIVYLLVPQPGHPGNTVQGATEYSYRDGVFLPPAGHIRVTVSSQGALLEYVTTSRQESQNGRVADPYRMTGQQEKRPGMPQPDRRTTAVAHTPSRFPSSLTCDIIAGKRIAR